MNELELTEDILDRMVRAVERVRERLNRAASALESACIPYAVVGGNAVAAWVTTIDEAAVRNTQDVDLLIRRRSRSSENRAFKRRLHLPACQGDRYVSGRSRCQSQDSVHVVYAGEKVRSSYAISAPDVSDAEKLGSLRVVALEPLVSMKLTSFRTKDQMHLRDMIDVGLVDASWLERLPADLAVRLQELLDNPEG